MKIQNQAAKWLLAGVIAGAGTASYAADPLTDGLSSGQFVDVALTGTIAPVDAGGCVVAPSSALGFDFTDATATWTPAGTSTAAENRWTSVPGDGIVTITCTADTTITFSTNNSFSRSTGTSGCSADKCTSWPVVFQPDIASGEGSPDNIGEGRVTANLESDGCTTTGACTTQPGVFNQASIVVVGTSAGAVTVEPTFSGTLIATGTPFGELQPSPRSQNPRLYVITQ